MASPARRKLAAILVADVVGYSRMVRADEEGTLEALKSLRADVIEPGLAEYDGRVVKWMGDGILAEFASAVEAVRTARNLQQAVSRRNAGLPEDRRILFRMGVNLGDIVIDGDDIHGDGVNVAARLESVAEPGSICISGVVHDQVKSHLSFEFDYLGKKQLKNIDVPVEVWSAGADSRPSPSSDKGNTVRKPAETASIAVLPFANMSNDPEQEYFADGITEDIITDISKIDGLIVISRNSSFTYKGKAVKTGDACRELGVEHILEGSVRKAGNRIRITAQLIEGRTGGHLWAERYDRDLADIFEVQDDVTRQIVKMLEVTLGPGRPGVGTEISEAYDFLLRGREQYRHFTKAGFAAARALYRKALELDPRYAAAYAGLAETYWQDWFMGDAEGLDRAFELAVEARDLDPELPLVYEALSSALLFKRRHGQAIEAAQRWIEIEPGNAEAYANLAGILHFSGEPDRVEELIDKAKRLNPFYPFYYPLYVGQARFIQHRFREAAEMIERSIAHNSESLPSQVYLAACLGQLDDKAGAAAALAEARRTSPGVTLGQAMTFAVYRREADLQLYLDGLKKAGLTE